MNFRDSLDRRRLTLAILMTASASLATPVIAASPDAVPPAQIQNGISYVTGGIGEPESTAMKSAGDKYDLMMTFAMDDGAFLSDVEVSISNQEGVPIFVLASGPILLVDLPDGTYKVQASVAGSPQVRTVQVGQKHHRLAYTWPGAVVD